MEKECAHYLITGATGYIGRMLTEYLVNEGNKVTLIVRDVRRCNNYILNMIEDSVVDYYECDITDSATMNGINGSYDYIVHLAAVTQSATMISQPVQVADGIVIGTRNILELAKRSNIKSMVYASSMEIYGSINNGGTRVTEDIYGDVDILSARSCYPMGKRMAEQYCYDYYSEYALPVKIARLAQTFGKGVSPEDNRVFMQFIKAVHEKKDIVLKTKGQSYGNYCEIYDAIRGIMTILHDGISGEAYNVVNEETTMKICEMADIVAKKIADGKINVVYDIDESKSNGYAPNTELRLSAEKLKALGWIPTKNLEDMYREMYAEYVESIEYDIEK